MLTDTRNVRHIRYLLRRCRNGLLNTQDFYFFKQKPKKTRKMQTMQIYLQSLWRNRPEKNYRIRWQ